MDHESFEGGIEKDSIAMMLRDLPIRKQQEIQRLFTLRTYPPETTIFSPFSYPDDIYVLERGQVSIYRLFSDRILTISIINPGTIFGEMALVHNELRDCYAQSMSACTVRVIGKETLEDIIHIHPQVAIRLMEIMGQRLHEVQEKLATIAFASVPQRLAAVLLSLTRHSSPPDGASQVGGSTSPSFPFTSPPKQQTGASSPPSVPSSPLSVPSSPPSVVRYTHQQLADMIGAYRETVTKTISDFRRKGLIRVESDVIYLTDVEGLQRECHIPH